jgi:hypothetical protein
MRNPMPIIEERLEARRSADIFGLVIGQLWAAVCCPIHLVTDRHARAFVRLESGGDRVARDHGRTLASTLYRTPRKVLFGIPPPDGRWRGARGNALLSTRPLSLGRAICR